MLIVMLRNIFYLTSDGNFSISCDALSLGSLNTIYVFSCGYLIPFGLNEKVRLFSSSNSLDSVNKSKDAYKTVYQYSL